MEHLREGALGAEYGDGWDGLREEGVKGGREGGRKGGREGGKPLAMMQRLGALTLTRREGLLTMTQEEETTGNHSRG